jgi:hypothetical protein
MCPTVRSIPQNFDAVEIPLDGLSEADFAALAPLLPELKDDLASRWPVKGIRLARPIRRRNPFQPNQAEMMLFVALTTGVVQKLGEKMAAEAFEWVRTRIKRKRTTAKKKQKKKRKLTK